MTRGTRAPQAAGVIHSDFERGFIRAETIAYDDYVTLGGEAGARDAGKMRLEGKDYVVADGDVMHFRFATSRLSASAIATARVTSADAVADGAEVLVDAEHDQHEFRDDAREHDADQHADQAGDDHEQRRERVRRIIASPVKMPDRPSSTDRHDREPIEDLDDRRRDEAFPLEQVAIDRTWLLLSTAALVGAGCAGTCRATGSIDGVNRVALVRRFGVSDRAAGRCPRD